MFLIFSYTMNNSGYIIIFLGITFLCSLFFTYLVKIYAVKKAILDFPNKRSLHSVPIPRGGGIAIAFTWFLAICLLFFLNEIESKLFYALLCGIPISLIGLFDDIKSISPRIRLSVQVISAIASLLVLHGINSIDFGIGTIHIPVLFSIIAIFAIIWYTNLFNFLDGIDGYLSSEVIFIGIAFYLFFGAIPPLLLSMVVAGFMVWNWHPAKIFMGDTGSTLLGFTIGVFSVYYQKIGVSSILFWLMLTSLFWFDATLTLFRRWRNNENLSTAHRKHAYQRIVQAGFNHHKVVLYSIVINIIIMILVWFCLINPNMLLLLFFVNIIFLYVLVKLIDNRFPFPK